MPGLSKILLPRVNPFILVGVADAFTLTCTYLLIQMGSSYLIDTYASIIIAIMTMGTMLPLAVYTGKILLQTTPPHLITQLDKCLREASTLDGVLEFRDEHFWTLSLGVLVGSLHIRVRRDADEQLVLAHVWNKLAGMVQILTIHVFKDDWMRRTTHQLIYNQQNVNLLPMVPGSMPAPASSASTSSSSQFTSSNSNTNNNYSNFTQIPLNSNYTSAKKPLPASNGKNSSSTNNLLENDFVIVNP